MNTFLRRGTSGCALPTLVIAVALVAAGCGSDDDKASSADNGDVVVSAATSLKQAFGTYAESFEQAKAQLNFAGSDELATQIRSGAKVDVFASANTKLPDQLYKEKRVDKPVVFTTNRLVLAVPEDSDKVGLLDDLAKQGTTLAIGAKDVPIGTYTRKVLGGLSAGAQKSIFANVKTEEPNVGGISAKLTQGAVDAGFLYFTDVQATNGRLKAIELPDKLQPEVAYGVAIVRSAPNRKAAQAFVDGLLTGDGAAALRDAGFEPPPA